MSTARRRLPTLLAAALLTTGLLAAGAARPQTSDPSFRLTNNSPNVINEIYVSSSAVNDWRPDRLGDRTLASGGAYVIRLPAGQCVNDIRVVYANGQANERRQVNTCNLTDIAFP